MTMREPHYESEFSVVIPMFNAARTIERTLTSVRSQVLPPVETIVVDDGSDDDSVELVRELFPNVTLIEAEHRGVGEARNRGLNTAHGRWVAFLDADDHWSPFHLSELARIVVEFPEAVMIATAHVRGSTLDAGLLTVSKRRPRRIDYFTRAGRDIGIVWTSSAAVRRELALRVGGFGRASHGEDLEFWARLALTGPVAVSHSVTALYVENPLGAMARRQPPVRDVQSSLDELSPSMQLIAPLIDESTGVVGGRSLRNYAAGRLASCVKGAVVANSPQSIRHFSGLLRGTMPVDRALFFAIGRYAPRLLVLLYRSRNRARRR